MSRDEMDGQDETINKRSKCDLPNECMNIGLKIRLKT